MWWHSQLFRIKAKLHGFCSPADTKVSRAEVIREAIAYYLDKKKLQSDDVFGLWKDHNVDGLAYQEQVRSEW